VRVLITGISGFAGSHLTDILLAQQDAALELTGISQSGGENAPTDPRIQFFVGDLSDPRFTSELLAQVSPARIYHLAAQAFVPLSWQDPWATLENNIRAQTNLLHALAQQKSDARILIVGSNEEYGRVTPADLPITETTPLRPDSPYGVSKIAQDFLGLQYFLSHHLHIVRVRPFNHIGPRQNDRFVTSNFAKQVAEIEAGVRAPQLRVGNLDAQRDFTDVRDMMRGYALALERGNAGAVYNIGSGKPRAIREIIQVYQKLTRVPFTIESDPERLRPSDTPVSYCDATKFRNATGWAPQISFEQTLHDILDDWRGRVAKNGQTFS